MDGVNCLASRLFYSFIADSASMDVRKSCDFINSYLPHNYLVIPLPYHHRWFTECNY